MNEKSCGAVVFLEDAGKRRYLILKHIKGHFDFPKGHVEVGESEEQTALREIKEETGLNVYFIPGFRKTIRYTYLKDGVLSNKEVVFFLAKANSPEVKISNEHESFAWMDFKSALNILTYKNSAEVLSSAEKFLQELN